MVCGTPGSQNGRRLRACQIITDGVMDMKIKQREERIEIPEITMRLACRLRSLLDDRDFVMGTLHCVQALDDQAALMEFIEKGENVTVSSVAQFAYGMDNRRAREANVYGKT